MAINYKEQDFAEVVRERTAEKDLPVRLFMSPMLTSLGQPDMYHIALQGLVLRVMIVLMLESMICLQLSSRNIHNQRATSVTCSDRDHTCICICIPAMRSTP